MRPWTSAIVPILAALPVRASDGPIDWSKAPGGGPSTLRSCAQFAYNDNARGGGGVNVYLGCKTNSCVCRTDLIQKAHDQIKYLVTLNCGEDATVDVEAATKIYNDYCSAAGYPIPGYTYVVTQTVQLSPGEATAPAQPSNAATRAGTTMAGGVVTVTLGPTATVTVISSSASRPLQPYGIFHLFYFIALIPIKTILALPDTLTVYFTPTPPPAAITSFVTTFKSVANTPIFSTKYVAASTQQVMAPSNNNPTSGDTSSTNTNNTNSGSRKDGLSKLEVAGIVIGIIVGIATTSATVWMCLRGSRGHLPLNPPAPVRERIVA